MRFGAAHCDQRHAGPASEQSWRAASCQLRSSGTLNEARSRIGVGDLDTSSQCCVSAVRQTMITLSLVLRDMTARRSVRC